MNRAAIKIIISLIIFLSIAGCVKKDALSIDVSCPRYIDFPESQSLAIPKTLMNSSESQYSFSDVVKGDLKRLGAFHFKNIGSKVSASVYDLDQNTNYINSFTNGFLLNTEIVDESNKTYLLFKLIDIKAKKSIYGWKYTFPGHTSRHNRSLAHSVSNTIVECLTQRKGLFRAKMMHVKKNEKGYQLYITEYDGNNPIAILTSNNKISNPDWHPGNKFVAYITYEYKIPELMIQELETEKRYLLKDNVFDVTNIEFSPSGKWIAFDATNNGKRYISLINLYNNDEKIIVARGNVSSPTWLGSKDELLFIEAYGDKSRINKYDVSTQETTTVHKEESIIHKISGSSNSGLISMISRNNDKCNIYTFDINNNTKSFITSCGNGHVLEFSPDFNYVIYDIKSESTPGTSIISLDSETQLVSFPDTLFTSASPIID
jgi:tol-pal system beta propeller repeat protein TolB